MQLKQFVLRHAQQFGVGKEVEESLIGIDGAYGWRLVETRLRGTLVERLADIEAGFLSIHALGIGRPILLECLRGTFKVLAHILSHTQHIETLLSIVATLHHGYDILQKNDGTIILAFSKALLGILVTVVAVSRLEYLCELACTTAQKERYARREKYTFLHFEVQS